MQLKNVCPVCRNVNDRTATACRYCGTPLTPPHPAVSPVVRRRRWPLAAGIVTFVALLAIGGIAALGGGGSTVPGEGAAAAPRGDVAQGQAIFSGACSSCHTTTQETTIGPGLAGLFGPGGPTLPPGVDYGGNLPNGQPITVENVEAWIRSGGQGQIGVMPPNGNAPNLTEEELTDLIAYLMTLTK